MGAPSRPAPKPARRANLAELGEELLETVVVYRVRDATHKDLHWVRVSASVAAAATASSTTTAAAATHAAAAVVAHATSGERGDGEPGHHPTGVATHHSAHAVGRAAHHAHAAPVRLGRGLPRHHVAAVDLVVGHHNGPGDGGVDEGAEAEATRLPGAAVAHDVRIRDLPQEPHSLSGSRMHVCSGSQHSPAQNCPRSGP